MTHIPGAGAVVFYGEYIVLLQHPDGSWVFPKGHLEGDETELQAALREVQEETDLFVYCRDPALSFISRYVNPSGTPRSITYFIFETDDITRLKKEEKFLDIQLVHRNEAVDRLTHVEDKAILLQVLEARHE